MNYECIIIGVRKLWQETQDHKTKEAQFVKQLDKLEMAIQALEYEERNRDKNMQEFFDNARMHINDSYLLQVLNEITKLRRKT